MQVRTFPQTPPNIAKQREDLESKFDRDELEEWEYDDQMHQLDKIDPRQIAMHKLKTRNTIVDLCGFAAGAALGAQGRVLGGATAGGALAFNLVATCVEEPDFREDWATMIFNGGVCVALTGLAGACGGVIGALAGGITGAFAAHHLRKMIAGDALSQVDWHDRR